MIVPGLVLCAAIGATLRALVTDYESSFNRQAAGTVFVNVAGSFLLGWLAGSEWSDNAIAMIGVGGLGAFTTFSTFVAHMDRLTRERSITAAVGYGGASLCAGIAAAYLGWLL